ncbi:protein of unknown function [Nitrospira japonica]|uniref:Uncharacterized protein n=1 Tax=Nitrospira japonica TaxID=1325564 RepID=A0A1W1I0H9_9BACT|nr:hypothetical protein [Nitrospira japonica]SLM46506.1 protein of unknown function [Nitrospira japonica]
MNHRVGSRPQPIKQLRIRPGELQVKYPSSLRPSPLRKWCWQTVQTCESGCHAFAIWLGRKSRAGWQVSRDGLKRMELGVRVRRGWITLKESTLRGAVQCGHGVKVAGQWGGRMVRDAARLIVRRFERREEKRPEHMPVAGFPMARFDVYGDFHFLQPSEAKQSFRRELARSHAQLAEQLRAEEEELSRVAARVVRLQSLLRAQQSLLLGSTRDNEAERASLRAPFQSLVGVGMRSDREHEHPDLYRPN